MATHDQLKANEMSSALGEIGKNKEAQCTGPPAPEPTHPTRLVRILFAFVYVWFLLYFMSFLGKLQHRLLGAETKGISLKA